MKLMILLPMLIAFVAAETYTTENDNLDIVAVVNNLNVLKSFIDCFNDLKPCDEVQADFKDDMPEAFRQACVKCTPDQKRIFRIFLEGAEEKLPEDLNILKKKLDPESKYYAPLKAAIANA